MSTLPAKPVTVFERCHFFAAMLMRAVAGIGAISGSVDGGTLLLLALSGAVKMLGNFTRPHHRLLKPKRDLA